VPEEQWANHKYAVKLEIPLASKTSSLFYFCHIHKGMSGEIEVRGESVEGGNKLEQGFRDYYIKTTKFDRECGTSGVQQYHTHREDFCPGMRFLCGETLNSVFEECMEAIDCKMNHEMRVEQTGSPLVVFMHQMIPHHENAVNMAKIALKHGGDLASQSDPDLDVASLLRDIINTQNRQIQQMQQWLERFNHGESKVCGLPSKLKYYIIF